MFPNNHGGVVRIVAGGEDLVDGNGLRMMETDDSGVRNDHATFAFKAGVYDLVVLINVLEHCHNALTVLQNAHNALKPGGILVIQDRFADDMWSLYFSGESVRSPNASIVAKWEETSPQATEKRKQGESFWDVGHPLNMV